MWVGHDFTFPLLTYWILKVFSDCIFYNCEGCTTPNSALELPLTIENVESVLDEIRPYLFANGGKVALHEIDGNDVRMKLQGACGSCLSFIMTMKMGIKRCLMEKMPEIVAVEPIAE